LACASDIRIIDYNNEYDVCALRTAANKERNEEGSKRRVWGNQQEGKSSGEL